MVCNGDESEPGTFKDRELLCHAPHLVIEGMLVAGLILNAKRGYIYIRHEYEEQIESVRHALRDAQREVPQAFARCPLEVFVSPGLYICGEESPLEVIEGRRAQPRNTPPEIRTNGLFDKPTVVNNVETYAWVPLILLRDLCIDLYAPGHGGECPRPYAAVSEVLGHAEAQDRNREATAKEVVEAITIAGRAGIGGPAADRGKKWEAIKKAMEKSAGDAKFACVVCTPDPSEVQTHIERELLARTPHLIVEGVLAAGLVLNARRSYICIRQEWREQIEAIGLAIGAAERHVPGVCEALPSRASREHGRATGELFRIPSGERPVRPAHILRYYRKLRLGAVNPAPLLAVRSALFFSQRRCIATRGFRGARANDARPASRPGRRDVPGIDSAGRGDVRSLGRLHTSLFERG